MLKRQKGKDAERESAPDLEALSDLTERVLKVPKSKLDKMLKEEAEKRKEGGRVDD